MNTVEKYFVIKIDEDSLTFDGPLTQQTLEDRLAKNYYGSKVQFVSEIPPIEGHFLHLKSGELLVIRGNIVQPRPEEVVTRWKL